jgi:hypothetical protein
MTAEEILTSVLTKCGLSYEVASVASTDPSVAEVVDLINETGQDLAARGEWENLLKSAAVGVLPADYLKAASVTIDAGGFARVVLMPELWELLQSSASLQPYYRIAGGSVEVSTGDAATLHYWSANWCDGGKTITANSDEVYIPGNVMVSGAFYRWLRKKGMPFDDQMAQHEADVETAQKNNRGAR